MADKTAFISANLHYASMPAIVDHCSAYIYDVLDAMEDREMIAEWLRSKGYNVIKQ